MSDDDEQLKVGINKKELRQIDIGLWNSQDNLQVARCGDMRLT